ncbi:MAG TPA: hypothetical protein VG498_14620 [Terriglobales bacterium]|nr:hypothetical protein [Terriglobales bacterium]
MNAKTWVARLVLLAVVTITFCVSSKPASASVNGTYSFTVNCNTVKAVVAGLQHLEEEIQEFADANPTNANIQEEAAEWIARIDAQINAIELKYSSCF